MKSIGKQLGSGTYGTVYASTMYGHNKTVAVKRLFVEKQNNFSFSLREMDVALKLKHPSILSISSIYMPGSDVLWPRCENDNFRDDDIAFIFEMAKGDLYHMMKSIRITETIGKNIIVQLLLALEYMHANGYIHRDIKPSNILHFENNTVKICDFGLCKKYFTNDKHTGVGSPLYKAPETLIENPVYDYLIDIWSIGCVIHYLFSHKIVPVCDLSTIKTDEYTIANQLQLQDIVAGLPYDVSYQTFNDNINMSDIDYTRKITVDDFLSEYIDLADPDQYEDFIFFMLQFDSRHRKSAGVLLEHSYLLSHSKIIDLSRKATEKNDMLDESLIIKNYGCKTREFMHECALELFIDCKYIDWYHDKVLFTSINIFDRLISSKPEFKELDKRNLQTYFKTCMYISAKYYSSHYSCDLSYNNFPLKQLSPNNYLIKAKKFEDCVLETLRYNIYSTSVYDIMIDNIVPSRLETFSLLLFILDKKHFDLTPEEAYQIWFKNKQINVRASTRHSMYKKL